jgi:hypothetical protein
MYRIWLVLYAQRSTQDLLVLRLLIGILRV